jgi:hypothetical protein
MGSESRNSISMEQDATTDAKLRAVVAALALEIVNKF